MANGQCARCWRPAINGGRFCVLHAGDPSTEKTQLVALDGFGVPAGEQAPAPVIDEHEDTLRLTDPLSEASRSADTDPTALPLSGTRQPPAHRLAQALQPAETAPFFPLADAKEELPEAPHIPPRRTEPTASRSALTPSPDSVPTLVPKTKPLPAGPAPALAYPRPRKPSSAIGRVLGGRFEVRVHLGSGAFGTTYVAWDARLRRDCVVKLLRPLSLDPSPFEIELRKRFANEALALAHLIHPNITQVFDSGEEDDGATWIAMELVRGRSLAEIQREQGRLEPARLARLGAQVASALAFAHSRGIVHRDLKPDNLLVVDHETGGEQVKVLDFGVARITDPQALGMDQAQANLTGIGAFLGTPAFMSPEQAEGASVGPASDIYSLGVVLFLLLTGKLPGTLPEAWTPLSTVAFVLSPAEQVRSLRPDCPAPLARIIDAMLAKDPHKRRLTAAQVEEALRAIEPKTAPRAPAIAAAEKPKRSPSVALTIGALVVAAGAVAALLVTRHQVEKQAAAPVARAAARVPAADSRAALREATVLQVLRDAQAGKPGVVVDPEADALLKGGSDARLEYAKGLAHLNEEDYDGAVAFFTQASTATDPKLAKEAADELATARQKAAQAHAERPKPRLEHTRRKAAVPAPAPTTPPGG